MSDGDFPIDGSSGGGTSSVSMTLCIAAICEQSDEIVTVSDFMVTLPGVCQWERTRPKLTVFSNANHHWVAMFTGESSENTTVCDYIRIGLGAVPTGKSGQWLEMRRVIQEAYLERLNEIKMVKPDAASLNIGLLVFGFDHRKSPKIFNMRSGIVCDVTDDSFGAIGDGWQQVSKEIATMFREPDKFHRIRGPDDHGKTFGAQRPLLELNDLIFRLCVAKFDGEVAPLVGDSTFVTIHNSKGRWRCLSLEATAAIRRHWLEMKKMPAALKKSISDGLIESQIDERGNFIPALDNPV